VTACLPIPGQRSSWLHGGSKIVALHAELKNAATILDKLVLVRVPSSPRIAGKVAWKLLI
jgi:hypothetical protein